MQKCEQNRFNYTFTWHDMTSKNCHRLMSMKFANSKSRINGNVHMQNGMHYQLAADHF